MFMPLVTLFFGSVIIAGRERKSFCGAFKARKSGGTGRRIGLRAPCHLQRLPNVFGAFSQSHQLRKLAKAGRPRLLYSSNRLQTDSSLSNIGRSLAGSLSSNSLKSREDILSPRPHMPLMTDLASFSVSGSIDQREFIARETNALCASSTLSRARFIKAFASFSFSAT